MTIVNTDFFSLLFIVICSIIIFLTISTNKKLHFKYLIILGFLLRIFLMLFDYYLFPVFSSGNDTETFHQIALYNQTAPIWISLTNYTYFLSYIYSITNSSRLIAQFINVLFGVGMVVLIQRSLSLLEINENIQKKTILIVVLLPSLINFSGILLREAWVTFFVAASLYYIIRWFKSRSNINLLLSVFMVLFAAIMHSGVLGLLLGYIVSYFFNNKRKRTMRFSLNSIVSLILLSLIIVLFINYYNVFTNKFAKFDFKDPDAFIDLTNKTSGASAYLTWIKTDNVFQGLVFAPLKMFYFLFSPLPTEWRGFYDIIAFCCDGFVYLWLCIIIYRSNSSNFFGKYFKKFFLISMLIAVFIFAYGTYNAGTAIRHRAKLIPLIVITYAVAVNYSTNKNKRIIELYKL